LQTDLGIMGAKEVQVFLMASCPQSLLDGG